MKINLMGERSFKRREHYPFRERCMLARAIDYLFVHFVKLDLFVDARQGWLFASDLSERWVLRHSGGTRVRRRSFPCGRSNEQALSGVVLEEKSS